MMGISFDVGLVVNEKVAVKTLEVTAPADEIIDYYPFWSHEPVIHALYFVRVIPGLVRDAIMLRESAGFRAWHFSSAVAESEQLVEATYALGEAYFDNQSKLFRVHPDDDPNLYAVDAGLRVIAPWPGPVPGSLSQKWREIAVASAEFADRCRIPGKPGAE